MGLFFYNHFKNYKVINWQSTHNNLFKLQNRIVQQAEKKNFRKVRHLQRLILKSLSPHLLTSQKIIEKQNFKKFNLYKSRRKDYFLTIFNLNSYIHLENNLYLQYPIIYFQFISLLWIFALLPLQETFADPLCYNYRLYRDQTDTLKGIFSILKDRKFKWVLIIKPNGFFNIKNKKWLYQNALIEKKFLFSILESKEFANSFVKKDNYNQELLETKKISLTKILKNYSLQNDASFSNTFKKITFNVFSSIATTKYKTYSNPIFYYNDLILIPNTDLHQLKIDYKSIFKFLKMRGLSIKKNRLWVLNLRNGFNFLGWFIKKKKGKTIVTISYQNLRSHKLEIKKFLKSTRSLSIDKIIIKLNEKIFNWQSYYAYASDLPKTWSEMNYYLFWRIWRWCKKRHKNKGSKWLYRRYWDCRKHRKWTFHANNQFLISYNFKKQKITYLPAFINVCKTRNLKKIQRILFKKYGHFKK